MTRAVPKAELHVHLEGTAPPDLIRRIAARNGLEVPDGVFATPERFRWRDFLDFLNTYDLAASVIRTAEDYRDITLEYLASCAAEGAIYVEVIASPDHARLVGLSADEMVAGVAAGIDEARAAHGIEARILLTAIRNFGVEQALRVVRGRRRDAAPLRRRHQPRRRRGRLPARAVRRGLRDRRRGRASAAPSTPASGPGRSPSAARSSCRSRGSRTACARSRTPASSPSSRERGIVLECCPTSNVALGVYRSYEAHPLPALREAGVRVTLGSDDPPYFGASVGGEYAIAHEHFGFDDAALTDLTRTAIGASFADRALRERLLARIGHGDGPPP